MSIEDKHHILKLRLSDGTISPDDHQYIGHASDGSEIIIGSIGDEDRVESYLRDYPGPMDW